jgi:hypothetical protein
VGSPTESPVRAPPVDILETDYEVIVLVALPGVDVGMARAVIEDGLLVIDGARLLPDEFRSAIIHRLELPQGDSIAACRFLPGTTARCVASPSMDAW